MAKRFLLMEGHHDEAGIVYKAGEPVVSNLDLVAIHGPRRFKYIGETKQGPPAAKVAVSDPDGDEREVSVPAPSATAITASNAANGPLGGPGIPLGDDVTPRFPDAAKMGLAVLRTEEGYAVVDGDNHTRALHREPLPKAADVSAFLAAHNR